jgi:regulator of protease activity HflC (stomatin/prohibitin superfamily)
MSTEVDPQPLEAVPVGHAGTRVAIDERPAMAINGWLGVLLILICGGLCVLIGSGSAPGFVAIPIVLIVLVATGLVIVQPGQTSVVRFFGNYTGTIRRSGLAWTLPFTDRRGLSIKVRNFETGHLKVNDADGNPVEIAAIVVWQVADTAQSRPTRLTNTSTSYRSRQSRLCATSRRATPMKTPRDRDVVARLDRHQSPNSSRIEVAARVAIAGVEIVEVRISHLAYSPEIAQAMLRRQQANAVVAARSRIVEGAVGMVEMALNQLNEKGESSRLTRSARQRWSANLMVVLCGDQPASPIVNTGSLYT